MSKKIIALSILLVASVLLSGCIFEDKNRTNSSSNPDFIPQTNLPPGFIFMGINDDFNMDIANSTIKGVEGVYRYNGKDIYIQAIKNDNPEALLAEYKENLRKEFKKGYNPFEEVNINGHAATKINDAMIVNGNQQMRYSIIWANKGYLIQVGSFDDPTTVFSLASATGY